MVEAVTIPYNFEPRAYQYEVFREMDSGKIRAFLRWSRRAGKDKTCFNYLIKRAIAEKGVYFYFFPSYSQGRKAVWEAIQDGEKLLDHIPKGLAKFNNNEMKIELANGSIIRIVGTDNYDSIVGTNPIGLVFSEYSLQDPAVWEYMQPILAQNGGWAIFNGTPRGKNHMYDLECSALKRPDQWCVSVVQSLSPDLPHFYPVNSRNPDPNSAESIQENLSRIQDARDSGMTEETVASEFGVSYTAAAEGTYYADLIEKARSQGRIGAYPYDDHCWVDTFWDLGKNDSTVIWFRQQKGDRLIFFDYLEDSGKTPAHYVQLLQEKGYRYRTHYLPHDAAHDTFTGCAKDIIEACLIQANISDRVEVAEKPNSKMQAINAVRARFSRYFFNGESGDVMDGIIKLSLYHRKFDPKRKVFLEHPVHDWTSHCADALSTEALTADINEIIIATINRPYITEFNPIDDDNL